MDYENEPWMKVYKRDTAGWADLDIFARGISLELGRHLDAKGELPLGRKGLPAVASTLRTSWPRIEEFILELLADGRLVHDEERQVLIDPQHAERQRARANAATRKRMERERKKPSRDVTRSHARSRDVTNRSDQKRSDQTLPSGEDARAPEDASQVPPEITPEPELEPEEVVPRLDVAVAELDAPMPPWAVARLEAVVMTTGVKLDGEVVWRKYVSKRLDPAVSHFRPMNAFDFNGWLCDQVRIERRDKERDRDIAQERSSGYLPRGNLLPRDTPPAPYHGVNRKLVAEREAWERDAPSPEETAAERAKAMAVFG